MSATDASSSLSAFSLPPVSTNAEGWGPVAPPAAFASVPFASFQKSDKIGKCADLAAYLRGQGRRYGRGDGGNEDLAYKWDTEEAKDFLTVEAKGRTSKAVLEYTPAWRGRGGPAGARAREAEKAKGGKKAPRVKMDPKLKAKMFRGRGGMAAARQASVKVEEDWLELEAVDFSALQEQTATPPKGVDLMWAGDLKAYDEEYDRMTTKTAKPLRRFEAEKFYYVTTKEDPHMQELAKSSEEEGAVFVTDSIITQIMACTRTLYPWDIVISYLPGGVIIIDSRDPFATDAHTCNETAAVLPSEDEEDDDINTMANLRDEATQIWQNFSQQVLTVNSKGKDKEAPPLKSEPKLEPNPYVDEEEEEEEAHPAAVAYRYRKFQLAPDTPVYIRTTVHAVQRKKTGEPAYLSVFALNEWDSKAAGATDFRQFVDTQRGNVLTTEIKNNAARLTRYTLSALLAGNDSIRLGFVSRTRRTDTDAHQVLGVASLVPTTFASQVAINLKTAWGIFAWLVAAVRKHARNLQTEDEPDDEYVAKFVFMRDPHKPIMRLFNIPVDAFDREDEIEDLDEEWGAGEAAEAAAAAGAGADEA